MDWKSAGRKSPGMSGRLAVVGFTALLFYFCFIRQLYTVSDLQSQSLLDANLTSTNHRFSFECNDPELHDTSVKDSSGPQCFVSGVFYTSQDMDEQAFGISFNAQKTNVRNATAAISPVPGIDLKCSYSRSPPGRKQQSAYTFNPPELIKLEFDRLLRTVVKVLGVSMIDSMEYAYLPAAANSFRKSPDRMNFQKNQIHMTFILPTEYM